MGSVLRWHPVSLARAEDARGQGLLTEDPGPLPTDDELFAAAVRHRHLARMTAAIGQVFATALDLHDARAQAVRQRGAQRSATVRTTKATVTKQKILERFASLRAEHPKWSMRQIARCYLRETDVDAWTAKTPEQQDTAVDTLLRKKRGH